MKAEQGGAPNTYPRHTSCFGSFLTRQESRYRQPSVIADVMRQETTNAHH